MTSIKGQINREEAIKWVNNSLTFLAPALIVFLMAIQNGVPWQQALYSVYLWSLNISIDFLKKLSQGV